MKKVIAIVLIMFLALWYVDTGSSVVLDKNKKILSAKEVKVLASKGVLTTPINYDKRYFSTYKVRYIKSKSKIPFIYNKDTLSDKGLQYWSESYE